jgi:hypothetical protein
MPAELGSIPDLSPEAKSPDDARKKRIKSRFKRSSDEPYDIIKWVQESRSAALHQRVHRFRSPVRSLRFSQGIDLSAIRRLERAGFRVACILP